MYRHLKQAANEAILFNRFRQELCNPPPFD